MRTKIKEIFVGNEFAEQRLELGCLYSSSIQGKESYWFVSDENLEVALENQIQYYNLCKETIQKESFDKNCNLIILKKISEDDIKNGVFNKIINVEEDPYIFRKYVIYYTKNEVNELGTILNNENLGDFIKINISNPELFREYKENDVEFNGYSLLYRLLIKLPFLSIESSEETLEDLRSKIESKISESKLHDDYIKIKEFINDKSLNEIKDSEATMVFSELRTWLGGEES